MDAATVIKKKDVYIHISEYVRNNEGNSFAPTDEMRSLACISQNILDTWPTSQLQSH